MFQSIDLTDLSEADIAARRQALDEEIQRLRDLKRDCAAEMTLREARTVVGTLTVGLNPAQRAELAQFLAVGGIATDEAVSGI